MKKFIKVFAAITGAALMFAFASCEDSSDPKKSDLELASEALTIIDEVYTNEINLPKGVAPYSDVTVTWVSSDTTIISYNESERIWDVTPKVGEGVDTVILTATLKEGESTITKEFTVKVPQSSAVLDDAAIVDAAIALVKSYLVTPVYQYYEFPFDGTITIRGKDVAVTFTTDNEKAVHLPTVSEPYIVVSRNIYDVTAKINGTFTLGTVSKPLEINLVLPAVTKFAYTHKDVNTTASPNYIYENSSILTFNPSKHTFEYEFRDMTTYTSGDNKGETEGSNGGYKGTYVLDPEKGTIRVTVDKLCASYFGDGKTYYTASGILDYLGKQYKGMLKAMEAFEKNPTLDNAYAYVAAGAFMGGKEYTRADFDNEILQMSGLTAIEDLDKAENADIKERVINSYLVEEMQMKYSGMNSFGMTDVVSLPPKSLITAMNAYETSKTVDNAVNFVVPNMLWKFNVYTKAQSIRDACSHFGVENISDFELEANADKKAAFLTKVDDDFNTAMTQLIGDLKLEKTASMSAVSSAYDTLYAKQWKDADAAVNTAVAADFPVERYFIKDALCKYEIDRFALDDESYSARAELNMEGIYDSTKPWYQQYGGYRDEDGHVIRPLDNELKYGGKYYYRGTWNEAHTIYTWVPDKDEAGETTTFTVTDNKNGTIALTKGTDEPVSLSFNGYYPLHF